MNVEEIIKFESGELSFEDTLLLFSKLIQSGDAWNLQGFYGRTAKEFIDEGFIDKEGKIDWTHYNETEIDN